MPAIKAYLSEPEKEKAPTVLGPFRIGFAIDESSSMTKLQNVVITGFNQLLNEQINLGDARADTTMVTFSGSVRVVIPTTQLAAIEPLSIASYHPCGGTALLDGMGKIISVVGERFDAQPGRAMIVILTDGMENSSRIYSIEWIKQLVRYRRLHCGWIFLFLAVTEAAVNYALRLGIPREHIVQFSADPAGLSSVLAKLTQGVAAYRLGNNDFTLLLK